MNDLLDLVLSKKIIIDFLPNGEALEERQLKQTTAFVQIINGLTIFHIFARVKNAKIINFSDIL